MADNNITRRESMAAAAAIAAGMLAGCGGRDGGGDVFSVIAARTSVRKFDPSREVDEALVEKLLRAAMCAPTARNMQPWEFVVVRDPAVLAELARGLPYSRIGNGARLAIIVCGNLEIGLQGREREFWVQDCSAATENLLLAAKALGLGAVWTAIYPADDRIAHARKTLGIPAHVMPLNAVPVGWPAENPPPKDKWKPERIHRDRW